MPETELVRVGTLPEGARFRTALTGRTGYVARVYSDEVRVVFGDDEEKSLHLDVLVVRAC